MEYFASQDQRSYYFLFRFEYLISGPKSCRDFRETGPRELPTYSSLKPTLTITSHLGQKFGLGEG